MKPCIIPHISIKSYDYKRFDNLAVTDGNRRLSIRQRQTVMIVTFQSNKSNNSINRVEG